jgi:hypothetical protein
MANQQRFVNTKTLGSEFEPLGGSSGFPLCNRG